jgi:hypothetical protein
MQKESGEELKIVIDPIARDGRVLCEWCGSRKQIPTNLPAIMGSGQGDPGVLASMPRIDWNLGILKDALLNCCQCCSWRRRSRTNTLVWD